MRQVLQKFRNRSFSWLNCHGEAVTCKISHERGGSRSCQKNRLLHLLTNATINVFFLSKIKFKLDHDWNDYSRTIFRILRTICGLFADFCELFVDYSRAIFGLFSDYFWNIFGLFSDLFWTIFGLFIKTLLLLWNAPFLPLNWDCTQVLIHNEEDFLMKNREMLQLQSNPFLINMWKNKMLFVLFKVLCSSSPLITQIVFLASPSLVFVAIFCLKRI